jgi:hypothetical protein
MVCLVRLVSILQLVVGKPLCCNSSSPRSSPASCGCKPRFRVDIKLKSLILFWRLTSTCVQIDIEGSEYDLLSSLHELDPALPRQLAIEFHLQSAGGFQNLPVRDDMGLGAFLLHLANLG